VKIVGERRIINGKEDDRGMIRMSKDAQRLVDFYESRLASTVDLAAYDTWLASVEATEGVEAEYQNAHIDRPALLRFNQWDQNGREHQPPKHITVAPEVSGLVIACQRAGMNLRGILGVPDVTPDESKPEQSGKAIGLRQREQAQATSHYADSTMGGIRHTGRIIISMGRSVWDAPQILRINGADEKPIEVVVSRQQHTEAAQQLAAQGKGQDEQIRHMLAVDVGEYDVTPTAGKGTDTARQETSDVITAIMPILPPPAQVRAAAVLVKNTDAPGMQELAQQLAPSEESGMVPVEQVEQLKQQAEQMFEEAKQKIAALEQQIASKRDELMAKMEMDEKQNAAKIEMADKENAAHMQMKEMELRAELAIEQVKQQGEIERAHIAAQASVRSAELQPNPSPELG
jgi:hypothetical protein